jgi:hypothetical protein
VRTSGASGSSAAAASSHPVWFQLIRAGIELVAGGYCIIQQFNTTRDSIFGLMQAGTQVPVHMTSQQLMVFLNGNADKLNTIAFTIALITQIVFWWLALPETRRGHHSRWRRLFIGILLLLEFGSDTQYASSTQTVINGSIATIFLGGWAWLGILLFDICISFGSSFVFLNGIQVLGDVFGI